MPSLRFLTLFGFFLSTLIPAIALGGVPAHLWSQRFGDTTANQTAYAVATDADGNIIVVGGIQGSANFGGSTLTSAGDYDAYVAKFDASGVHQWSQHYGDAAHQNARGVSVDASGDILVTGGFNGTINLGGGNLASAGNDDIFLVKLNAAGVHQWSKRFGDATSQSPSGITTDASENVIITGGFAGTVNFGGASLVCAGSDVFIAKFNAAGTHVWSQIYGDASSQAGLSVDTDASENVIVSGQMQGTVNFGGGDLTSAGFFDIFLAKFNSAGAHQWSQRFGDATPVQQGWAVAVDASDNVIMGGSCEGNVDFGGGLIVGDPVDPNVFVAKFNSAGVHQWSQLFGDSPAGQGLYGLAVDAAGNIAISGQYSGTVNFGGGNLVATQVANMYLASLTPAGAHRWSARYGGSASPYGVAFDPLGNLVSVGSFGGSIDFGGATLMSPAFSDIFVAKFGNEPAEPAIVDIVDVPNDQGRHVKIRFVASGVDDAAAANPIQQYEAFRRTDPAPALTASTMSAPGSINLEDWLFVAAVPAHAEDQYEIHAETLGDSTVSLGGYDSVFFIRAASYLPSTYFDSPLDSGYSLDNLAPAVPFNFAYAAGNLTWGKSSAADFDYFSVYGGESFATATLIGYTVDLEMDVTASPYIQYFITATDFSGNEGKPAAVNTLTSTNGTPKPHVLSVSAYPNPFNPKTTIRYTLSQQGRATIVIYDARGARIRTLLDSEQATGAYSIPWDGRSDVGATVSSGVYFARIESGGAHRTYKMVLLK